MILLSVLAMLWMLLRSSWHPQDDRGNPQRRFVQPDEVAGTALWLCSDAARSVNGHTLSISGGEI